MKMRRYQPSDCGLLSSLFYETVHTVNARDYSREQLEAWADGNNDLEQWNRSFLEHDTLVALEEETIVGFGDMDASGYLDRLYVHKDYQRRGIASAILRELEKRTGADKIVTQASVTAKPFFERLGFRTVSRQQVERKGIWLTNYVMEKALLL